MSKHISQLISEAFRVGQELIDADADAGFHFQVATTGGDVFTDARMITEVMAYY